MKLSMPVLLLSLLLVSSLSTAALAQAPAGPRALAVSVQPSSVTVDGVTAKGQVVWFSVAREVADDDVATVVRRAEVQTDDDGDGKVVWNLDGEVPLRSIWVAVDLATGQAAAAAPEGYPLRRVGWRGRGLGRDNPRADRVEDLRTFAEVLLVRPGQGAWRLTARDGRSEDDDGAVDGKIAAALDRMQPVTDAAGAAGTAGSPERFDPKDVVVLIDPNKMELTLVQVGGDGAGQGVGQ